MFRQCAGDAAPGSSQTAFGSGSFLLAPLSNFRAGTLPTTVSLPHSHKPETDSLPACLTASSPSHSLSPFLPRSAFGSLNRSFALTPCFLPTVTNSLLLLLLVSHSQSLPLSPSLCLSLVLRPQDYRPAVSLTASKSCCTLTAAVSRQLSPPSLALTPSLSLHLSSIRCGLTFWL